MTLSPVFRSPEAVQALAAHGVWTRLAPASEGQAEANAAVLADLRQVLDAAYVREAGPDDGGQAADPAFIQRFFFLVFFRSVLETLGVGAADLAFCSQLNFCIKGTITAADNLFDDQDKDLLSLRLGRGVRFPSILQMLAFERLAARTLRRAVESGCLDQRASDDLQRELLSRMAAIGTLEGSEEGGVSSVLTPEQMLDAVHRVRGGQLFELAFVAPRWLTAAIDPDRLSRAQAAVAKLGTAFQIVDDLTDFEVDLRRGSHNLLTAQITHHGTADEKRALAARSAASPRGGDVVADLFADSARAVLATADAHVKASLEGLQAVGFWLEPALGPQLVRALVGMEGVERMRALTS